MKKSLKTVLISMFILFTLGGSCLADVVRPGMSPAAPNPMRTKEVQPSIWKFILIGIIIIAIVTVVTLIIKKKSKQKKDKESNDKTDNK